VFVNHQLVIDLGGTHAAQTAELALSSLGLTSGEAYALDIFYAERLGATGEFGLQTDMVLVPVLSN
jgi:fibro-slime domain-containing protein